MELLIPSFLAGVLTILAPCVLSLLPVILGGSITHEKDNLRPVIIIGSLSISVILFTLLLKASTLLIDIPQSFWRYFSGGLIIFLAFTMLFPNTWSKIVCKLKLYKSESLIEKNKKKKGTLGAVLLGASLGPVFTTCSPTFVIIVATVLPANFAVGFVNLIVYTIGMAIPLLIIAYGGRKVVKKLKIAAKPTGWFKRIIATILLLTGIIIFFGVDKVIEGKLIKAGYQGLPQFEQSITPDFN